MTRSTQLARRDENFEFPYTTMIPTHMFPNFLKTRGRVICNAKAAAPGGDTICSARQPEHRRTSHCS